MSFTEFIIANFNEFLTYTGFSNATIPNLIMIAVGAFFIWLAIKKDFEPLLLVPIGLGIILGNIPFRADAGLEIGLYEDNSVLNIFYQGVRQGWYPPLVFLGIGAMTDFSALIANPKLILIGAAAQFGIFGAYMFALAIGFEPNQAAGIAIIGGADGPTAIFLSSKTAPNLMGAIAVCAYSYMALVPVIIPLVVKCLCSEKELRINMKEQDKLYPDSLEIKNMRVLKIVFPIAVTTIVAIFVPTAVSLVGMLMFGNLLKEIGNDTFRLFDAASNGIMNAATIFLGLCVGATMTVDAFINVTTLGIVAGGFCAFALSIASGICMVKIWNLFAKKKINPLIGATGLSAVPMASRVCNGISTKYDPKNHVLNYCMSSNISGVIGSAVAAGVLISFLG